MSDDSLLLRANALKLYGVVNHWSEIDNTSWVKTLLSWEEEERSDRSLKRRLNNARIGRFKSLNEFDWAWPKKCDRWAIEECMQLGFIKNSSNIILCGPNGVGKTTIACNITYQAILKGKTALFVTAGDMLNNLASQDGDHGLRRRIKYYAQPQLLAIDEVGYLSYSNRHADLLFEVIAQRYQKKPTLITTNKPFSEWGEIFPNASCVVSLIDRLIHRSEIINIDAESFRLKEANEDRLRKKELRANSQKINKSKK